jgi:hypothetical protein
MGSSVAEGQRDAPLLTERPYIDSTKDLGTPAVLQSVFRRDGYVYLKGLLPRARVDAVADEVLRVAADHKWLADDYSREVPLARPGQALFDPDPEYRAVHRRMWSNEGLHALMHDPNLLDTVRVFVGEDVLVHPLKVLRAEFPDPPHAVAATTTWHQDFPTTQGSLNTVTAWTPLTRCDAYTGALRVVPGSHNSGVASMRVVSTADGWAPDVSFDEYHCGPIEPGDVIFFSALTLHGASTNRGTRLRLSIDCRYQPVAEPISRYCLKPLDPQYRWDQLYEGWREDKLKYYWRDHSLLEVNYDPTWARAREQAALEAARAGDTAAIPALALIARFRPGTPAGDEASQLLLNLQAREVLA